MTMMRPTRARDRASVPFCLLLQQLLLLCTTAAASSSSSSSSSSLSYRNVYGNALQSCSQNGMALTGYTRSGYCIDQNDDAGSHHICIDLSSTTSSSSSSTTSWTGSSTSTYYYYNHGGNSNVDDNNNGNANSHHNFCQVTGQSNWCDSTDMPCHENASDLSCPIQHWCVCQWAFASYIAASSGGCDAIQDIECDAINEQAILAYQTQVSIAKYRNALECLVTRCGLDQSVMTVSTRTSLATHTAVRQKPMFWVTASTLVLLAVAAMVWHQKKQQAQPKEGGVCLVYPKDDYKSIE